jgi:hypothetical protein
VTAEFLNPAQFAREIDALFPIDNRVSACFADARDV